MTPSNFNPMSKPKGPPFQNRPKQEQREDTGVLENTHKKNKLPLHIYPAAVVHTQWQIRPTTATIGDTPE